MATLHDLGRAEEMADEGRTNKQFFPPQKSCAGCAVWEGEGEKHVNAKNSVPGSSF